MNKNRVLISLTFILFTLSLFGQQKVELTELTIISYNIWNGFDWGKDAIRKEKVIEWVKLQDPNVVALQELCGYTREKLLEDAKAWGHAHAEILKTSGYPVGITSSQPIVVKERILENMHHGAMHCQIGDIDFMVVHFSPFSYKKRHEDPVLPSEPVITQDCCMKL